MQSPNDSNTTPPLAQTLLHDSPRPRAPERRYAYPLWGIVLVSLFVAYHATVLLVHNLPSKGLSQQLYSHFNKHAYMNKYMRFAGSSQSWAMFAPNPHRSNIFMKVLVKDKQGDVYDMKHDIYGKRAFPYLFYDRMGKINRRIVDEKGYRRHYAAWVCREWERTHEGEPAEEVRFVKMWTRIPPPEKVYRSMGYDPMKLHLYQRDEETIRCRTTRHGQLPPELRVRMGLPEEGASRFLGVQGRTWVDELEAQERREQRETKP